MGYHGSLTEEHMFASVLFRRIFPAFALISVGLHLLLIWHCTWLTEQYVREAGHAAPIRDMRVIEQLLCARSAEKISGEILSPELRHLLSEKKIGNTGYVFLFDRDLHLIFHPDPDVKKIPLHDTARIQSRPEQMKKEDSAIRCFSDRGKTVWTKYVKERGWYAAIIMDADEAEHSGREFRNRILFSFFAVQILFLLLLAFLLHAFFRPLQYLQDMAAEFIRTGSVSQKPFVADSGEIGFLSWTLHRMTAQLGENMRKIKSLEREHANLIRASDRARARAYDLDKAREKLEWEVQTYREAEVSLRQSEERYRSMLENIEECFYEADLLGNLVFFNDALCRMLGYSKEELLAMNYRDFMDEATAEKAEKTFTRAFETGIPAKGFEWTLICKDGSPCYVELSVFLIKDEQDEILGFRGVARNISDLLYLIYHDSLTGLYNRKAFFQRLKETLAYARRDNNEKNIFYMDLDRFKQVNDAYGHDVGDEILKEVAARLKSTLRETDHICRLGGDEFTVILNNAGSANPAEAARRILESLSHPYIVKEHLIDFITPSIGISSYPRDAADVETLVKCADIAMYASKKHRGCFTFYDKSLEERDEPQKE
ncbi:MAG: diguanylate cyclase [Desulfobacterales bacterium]